MTIRVLVADDQTPFRKAARSVLDATPDFELVGEASSGEEAVSLVDRLRPDLVLMDIKMTGIGGIEAARLITSTHPETRTILLSTYGWVNGGPFHFGVKTVVNHPHYKAADLNDLVNKVNTTPDGPDRLKVLGDAQEMYAQVIPDFPLYYPTVIDAYSSNINGYSAPVDAYQIDFTKAFSS